MREEPTKRIYKKIEKLSAWFPDKQQRSFQMREEWRLLWIFDYTTSRKNRLPD